MIIEHGIVVDVNDPLLKGRVRVRVQGVHDSNEFNIDLIPTEELGWSDVISPGNSAGFKGKGHSSFLLVGSAVMGYFDDGTKQIFTVLGSVPTTSPEEDADNVNALCSIPEHTTKVKCEEAGGIWGVRDINVRARGEADPNADQEKGVLEPASSYGPEYPYNNVFESESGHVKEYDDTPGKERIHERHKSGSLVEIQPDGTKVEKIVRDRYTLVLHDDTLEVQGTVNIVVSENCNLAVAGDVTANIKGNTDIQIEEGNLTTLIKKGNCDLELTEGYLKTVLTKGNCDLELTEGNLTTLITGTSDITSTGNMSLKSPNIKLDGDVIVTGTTTTSNTQLIDDHTHTYSAPLHVSGTEDTGKLS